MFYSDMKLMTKYEMNKISMLTVSEIWTHRTGERSERITFCRCILKVEVIEKDACAIKGHYH